MNEAKVWSQRWALFAARTAPRRRPNPFRGDIRRGRAGLVRLVDALRDPSLAVRLDALDAIALLHDRGHVTHASLEALLALAGAEPALTEALRRALFAIGRANVPALNAGFLAQLDHADPRRAIGAAYALAGARCRSAVPSLAAVASSCRRPCAAAIWALGQIGDMAALPFLHRRLHRGDQVRWVAGALGELAAFRSIAPLSRWADHPRVDVRFVAATAMLRCATNTQDRASVDAATLSRATRALSGETDPVVSMLLVTLLAALGGTVDKKTATEAFRRWQLSDRLRALATARPPPAHRPPEGPHALE